MIFGLIFVGAYSTNAKMCSGLSLMPCSLDDGTHTTTVLQPDTAFSSLADAATRSYHLGRADKDDRQQCRNKFMLFGTCPITQRGNT